MGANNEKTTKRGHFYSFQKIRKTALISEATLSPHVQQYTSCMFDIITVQHRGTFFYKDFQISNLRLKVTHFT